MFKIYQEATEEALKSAVNNLLNNQITYLSEAHHVYESVEGMEEKLCYNVISKSSEVLDLTIWMTLSVFFLVYSMYKVVPVTLKYQKEYDSRKIIDDSELF